MAEAAATKQPSRPSARTASSDQRAVQAAPATSTPSKPTAGSSALGQTPPATMSPWSAMDSRRASSGSTQIQQPQFSAAPILTRASGSQASPVPVRTGSAKIITPVKLQPPAPGSQRKASGGSVWSTTAGFAPPVAAPAVTSPDVKPFSLLSIQQEEREYADRSSRAKPVKSFAEIIEEERVAEAERAEKIRFDEWWQTEQKAQNTKTASAKGDSPEGHKRGRGGGRGGGQRRMPPRGGSRGARGGRGGHARGGAALANPHPGKEAAPNGQDTQNTQN